MNKLLPMVALLALVIGISSVAGAKGKAQLTGVVNINSATAEELAMLPGIGLSKATAIVDLRKGEKFKSTEDIMKVRGVGQRLFEQIQAYITVNGPTTAKLEKDVSIN